MTHIQVDVPQEIARKFSHKSVVSYQDIVDNYEDSFEYEPVNMNAKDFENMLISELSHDSKIS